MIGLVKMSISTRGKMETSAITLIFSALAALLVNSAASAKGSNEKLILQALSNIYSQIRIGLVNFRQRMICGA